MKKQIKDERLALNPSFDMLLGAGLASINTDSKDKNDAI